MTFRPTLERARAELQPLVVGRALHLFGGTDLLSAEGVEARPLAAVILRAAVLVKVVTEREAEVGADQQGALAHRGVSGAGGSDESVLGFSEPGRCTTCALAGFDAGRITCTVCGGSGTMEIFKHPTHTIGHHRREAATRETVACTACHGARTVVCPTCGGTRRTVRARLRRVAFEPRLRQHVYLPSLRLANDERLVARLADCTPPEVLRLAVGAGEDPPDDGSLDGFDFEDRLEIVQRQLEAMFADGEVVQHDCRVYGWPLLVLRAPGVHGAREAEGVVFVEPAGALAALVDE